MFDRGLVRSRSKTQSLEELDGVKEGNDSRLIDQAANLYNSSSWPKRVLVEYVWVRDPSSGTTEVDVGFGLTSMFFVAFLAVAGIMASILFFDNGASTMSRKPTRVPSDLREPPLLPTAALRTLLSDAARELSGSFNSLGADFDPREDNGMGSRRSVRDGDDTSDDEGDDHVKTS